MRLINLGEPFAQLVGTGITAMGIMNWMGGSDSGDGASQGSGAGDDAFGDGGGGDDDLFGGGDDAFGGGGGDDPFGGGGDDDPFGDDAFGGDEGGAATEELENRLDDLESEVAQLSSSVNTVRSENEEIAESVGETEENVRKLLEIYEMVTRGVNPFVDETQGGGGGSFGGGGDFGLFGEEEAAPQTEDDLDSDVTDAEADSFFDDDAFDEADEDDFADAEDDFGEFDEFEEDADDDPDADDGTAGGSGGGTTFEDLKAEYDSGDADWAGEDSTDAAVDVELDGAESDDPDADDADGEEFGSDIEFELGDADAADDGFELAESDPDDEFEYAEAVDPDAEAGREPYLSTLPDGYLVDLVVLEWLDSLVTEFGAENAVRAVDYYVEIDWLSASVGDHLMVYLEGLTEIESPDDLTGPAEMDVDDHVRSLTFITKLAGDGVDRTTIERRMDIGGHQHGLQC